MQAAIAGTSHLSRAEASAATRLLIGRAALWPIYAFRDWHGSLQMKPFGMLPNAKSKTVPDWLHPEGAFGEVALA